MRDFRFHIASLMAVFLALGVGMVIGYGVALSIGIDPLRLQIDMIRKHDRTVEDENHQLHQEDDTLRQNQQHLQGEVGRLSTLSITGRLSGRTIALVTVGPPPSASLTDTIWDTLLTAGARRLNETIIHGSLLPPAPAARTEILSRIQAGGVGAQPPAPDQDQAPAESDPEELIVSALGRTIGAGTDPTLPSALSHRGVPIDPAGIYGQRPDLVVILSQVDTHRRRLALERGETPETALIRSLQQQNVRVIECEPSTNLESSASYFRRLGISSVDDVETPEGQVSLVWAALGYTGHYGTRPGADALLPGGPLP